MKVQVILNCRTRSSLQTGLVESLQQQTCPHEQVIVPNQDFPSRISQIQDPRDLYVFLDEDVLLPHAHYLEEIREIFQESSDLLFLTGAYMSPDSSSYLQRCYNSLVTHWIHADSPNQQGFARCLNAPGGAWIVSGKILSHLSNWVEPTFWGGEDTWTLRQLQQMGVDIFYHPSANVYHRPRSEWLHFLRRAYRQGQSRTAWNLSTPTPIKRLKWSFILRHSSHWPGWMTHHFFVEAGSMSHFALSRMARKIPKTSPTP
ncbi:MAG: glycosyltransferase family 2 protein [Bdellovibrionales bacterium]